MIKIKSNNNLYNNSLEESNILKIATHNIRGMKNNELKKQKIINKIKEIIKIIKEGLNEKFKIIIMGDFNSDAEKIQERINTGSQIKWQDKLIKYLLDLNFSDTDEIINKMHTNTWFNNDKESKLDYIFFSEELILELVKVITRKTELYKSDHK